MQRKENNAILDAYLILISILVAFYLVRSGFIETLHLSSETFPALAHFTAGLLFTSVFTTAPAIVILGGFAQHDALLSVVVFGALGAVVGDYFLFRFVRDRVAVDIRFLLSHSKFKRLPAILKTKLFHSLTPFLGALIIASPLPDELGLTLLGLSKVSPRFFFFISFVMNALGILLISWVAMHS